jgi:hypothetical protein
MILPFLSDMMYTPGSAGKERAFALSRSLTEKPPTAAFPIFSDSKITR